MTKQETTGNRVSPFIWSQKGKRRGSQRGRRSPPCPGLTGLTPPLPSSRVDHGGKGSDSPSRASCQNLGSRNQSKRGQRPPFFFFFPFPNAVTCRQLDEWQLTVIACTVCADFPPWSALLAKTLSCSSLLPHCFGQGTINNLAKQTTGSF